MEAITLPNASKVQDLGNNRYSLTLEPLYPQYGTTIGNALRRVLLSSMPGAAVTAVKIKYVDHEFSTIPNVKEDVIQILLNLKQLRVKSFSAEPVHLMLKAKGERPVTAADIKETDQVQVINKDLYIATLDNKNADFEMELVVEQGRGWVPVEARENQKYDIGMIAVDAVFSPIRSAHFDVSNVRVGQFTNYDKLELYVETDGSITGEEAINIAAHILVDHFTMMFTSDFGTQAPITTEESPAAEAPVATGPEEAIENTALSTRAKNALTKAGIATLTQLQGLSNEQIVNVEGLGEKTIKEIIDYLGRN